MKTIVLIMFALGYFSIFAQTILKYDSPIKDKAIELTKTMMLSKNQEELTRNQQVLRDAIRDDIEKNNVKDDGFSEFCLYAYSQINQILEAQNNLDFTTRQAFYDLLAEGTVSSIPLYHKERIIKYLSELLASDRDTKLSAQFLLNIEKAYTDRDSFHDPRYLILVIAYSGSEKINDVFKLYANKFPDDYYRVYYSSEWTATLLRARKGDRKAIKHLVRLAEKSFLVERFSLLIKDLETVSDKIIIAYFDAYLNSDLKWTPFKEPEYVAAYSAKALRRLVVDFPVFENYNSIDNILKCREWMKEHKGKIVLIK